MDRLRKLRRPLRASLTRTINEVETELAKDGPDLEVLKSKLEKLEDVQPEVIRYDNMIIEAIVDDVTSTDEQMDEECSSIEDYKDKVREVKRLLNSKIYPCVKPDSRTPSEDGTSVSESGKKRNYKLPKIEVKKFNGELREWLSFWSQFRKIHEDEELHETDKFQYLVQSMSQGSRARELVLVYPQTAENYPKVVQALKDRYGKTELLTQVYVRDLLTLVINSNKSQEKMKIVNLYDQIDSQLKALESLDLRNMKPEDFLYPMVESSLSEDILMAWQRSSFYHQENHVDRKSKLSCLMDFLKIEVEHESQRTLAKQGFKEKRDDSKGHVKARRSSGNRDDIPTVSGLHVGDKCKCIFCEGQHESKECGKGQGLTLADKNARIRDTNACYLCLGQGHGARNCKAYIKCHVCGNKHVTIMCPELHTSNRTKERPPTPRTDKVKVVNANVACSSQVVLGTLKATLQEGNRTKDVRIFYDPGSQRNYITKKMARDLRLNPVGEEQLIHSLFGAVQTDVQNHKKYIVTLKNSDGLGSSSWTMLDKQQICGNIPRMRRGKWMEELSRKNIRVSDIGEGCPEIDVLLGADAFSKLITGNIHHLRNGLTAIETTLGWMLMGECDEVHSPKSDVIALTVTDMQITDASVQQLWDLEMIGIADPIQTQTKEEKEETAKRHFQETVSRNEEGRYAVSLPWMNGKVEIPNNRRIAEKRLERATDKLLNMNMYKKYEDIFENWLAEGIIEEVEEHENKPSHYLPHRAVFKPESLTTPIRPVFDASCKSGRAPSLNDCLEKGPNLLDLIPSIIMRFRMGKFGVISDIRKAFLMIEVHEEDRDYMRFLWWKDYEKKSCRILRHKRVVFGVNCSPFLLGAVLELHLKSTEESVQDVAEKLLQSLYVDNCVTSVDTLEEYEDFKVKATALMAEAKMELRLWEVSGGSGIGPLVSRGCGLEATYQDPLCSEDALSSVLGMKWNKAEDLLMCDFHNMEIAVQTTKRKILSCIQKVYDPMGFLCPALLWPKRLLQRIWCEKIGWDELLDEETVQSFQTWYKELPCLAEVKIPRNATNGVSNRKYWQLHMFCDASQDGYAAAVFLITEMDSIVSVQLLQAKARVAPTKKMTIPRLELLSYTIGARLMESVKNALKIEDVPIYYWSDSTTALAWIHRNDDWGTFVGNRVREILKLTSGQGWNHVPGKDNPADLPSRGCSPSQLLDSEWWKGPNWLCQSSDKWSTSIPDPDEDTVNEEKKRSAVIAMVNVESKLSWVYRSSSHGKNIRLLAWIRRFLSHIQGKDLQKGYLTVEEMRLAEFKILRIIQEETFKKNEDVISGIKVQRDERGLLRVRTKLIYRADSSNFRLPILLPHSHPVVDQIIEECHRTYGHTGIQFLMGKLRERSYWILQGRKAIRRVVSKCTMCRKFTGNNIEVIPSPLPADRVNSGKVFDIVGVDLAGPLYLKGQKKTWILLVTCAVYRAIHLELVRSISTEDFLTAFMRFVFRRGHPSIVFSDNGTNFVGASNLFGRLNWDKITKECGLKMIQWRFNPPSAPWWGGWWERLIGTVKNLLRRCLGRSSVTSQKLSDYLCEIESFVNGRPLTTVTEDPEDLTPLTPAMFLSEVPAKAYTELDFISGNDFRKLYEERKQFMDDFKSRFRKEYLAMLVDRKSTKNVRELKVGEVVLIGAENKKRWECPLARVLELIPGKDGNVRVAKLKTVGGILTRPTQRLYPLEADIGTPFPKTVKKEVPKKKVRFEDDDESTQEDESSEKFVKTRYGRTIVVPKRFEI